MISPPPHRSALYLPASNPRAIDKARELACDVVILDLEDAVAPGDKASARDAAAQAVRAGGFGERMLVVRVNAPATAWGAADLAMVAAARPDAVLLPKVDGAGDIAAARRVVSDMPVWSMVETPAAVLALEGIATAPGLAALVVGTNDLATMLRARPGPARVPLHPHLARIVAAARANGLVALDGVFNAIDDAEGLAAECAQGRAFGFDGKTLIHPGQIAAANAAFSPDAAELVEAQAIVVAFAAAPDAGVLRVDGRMVERLHLADARRILALAAAAAGGE